jgi:hypothetical protein
LSATWPRSRSSAALTTVAAVLAILAGLVHVYHAPVHLAQAGSAGAFMLIVGAAQLVGGALLLERPSAGLYCAGISGTLALLVTYVVSRTTGLPVGSHAGHAEAVELVDLISKALEIALLVILCWLVRATRYRTSTPASRQHVHHVLQLRRNTP